MDYSQEFLDRYKDLESVIREQYHYDQKDGGVVAQYTYNEKIDTKTKNELNLCREVRNFLQHNTKVNGEHAVVPSKGMIDALDRIIKRIKNPPRVSEIMIKDIFSATPEDALRPAMQIMADKAYTHVPILDENAKLIGVFSENTLLSGILDDHIAMIDSDATFSNLADYLPIDKHASEVFGFIKRDALIADAKEAFDAALQNGERLGMLFVTQNGKEGERLLGILTAWDIAAADSSL